MTEEGPGSGDGGETHSVGAIIVDAGQGLRMGGQDKVLVPLLGVPLVLHSLQVFNDSPEVAAIVLVVSPENQDRSRRLVQALP